MYYFPLEESHEQIPEQYIATAIYYWLPSDLQPEEIL